MPDKRGLTPGGYRDPNAVHRVRSNERLHRVEHGFEIRDKSTGAVHRRIDARGLEKAKPGAKAAPVQPGTAGNGWQAYAEWSNTTGTPISLMQATFVVPPPPSNVGNQTIFLFPGIENLAGDVGILQPVLQWGVSAMGGGAYWAVASWYVPTTGAAFYSNDLVNVDPTTPLTGTMRLVPPPAGANPPGGTFYYDSVFEGIAGTDLATGDLPELTWGNLTLEAYEVAGQTEYPNTASTSYSGISLVSAPGVGVIPWAKVVVTGAFCEGVNIVSANVPGGQVDIDY